VVEIVRDVWWLTKRHTNVYLVVDTSGSMHGSKLARVQEALQAFLEQIKGDTERVGLVAFSSTVYRVDDLDDCVTAARASCPHRRLVSDGDTALLDAVSRPRAPAEPGRQRTYQRYRGHDRRKENNSQITLSRLERQIREGNQVGLPVVIFCIAYGDDADMVTLERSPMPAAARCASVTWRPSAACTRYSRHTSETSHPMTPAEHNLDTSALLRQRAQRAILTNALMRWESAVLIALTLFGTSGGHGGLDGTLPWLAPAAGFGAGLVRGRLSLSAACPMRRIMRAPWPASCAKIQPQTAAIAEPARPGGQGMNYRDLLQRAVQDTREGILRERLARAIEPVTSGWRRSISLATRLDTYALNKVIQQDMRAVPEAITNFKRRLVQEDNPAVQATLQKTIADKERQWEQLSQLQAMMEKAEYQLEGTLAMLGTIYAQLQAIDLQATERGRDEQLRAEINEQVQQLQDVRGAMDEVYQSRSAQAGNQKRE